MISTVRFTLAALALSGLLLTASQTAMASDIFEKLESRSDLTAPPDYVPYRHTVAVTVSGSKGETVHEPLTARLRIDPSRPAGERVAVLERSGEARGEMEKALREMIEEIEDEGRTPAIQAQSFWCQSGADTPTAEGYELVSQSATQARLKPTPETMVSLFMQTGDRELDRKERSMAKKLSDRLDGEVVYDLLSGRMTGAKFHITRPMTVLLVAKIHKMEMEQSCAVAPNGHAYVSGFSMDVGVKALGQDITNVMELTVGDLERIEPSSASTETDRLAGEGS